MPQASAETSIVNIHILSIAVIFALLFFNSMPDSIITEATDAGARSIRIFK